MFIFFQACERAESSKSCNLIASMKSGRYFTILPAEGPIVYYVAGWGGGGGGGKVSDGLFWGGGGGVGGGYNSRRLLIWGVNFENAQNVSGIEILTHRTGILCKSCQTYIMIEAIPCFLQE